ncbi:hypothetical protein GPECTOR_227g505 [Gonium pectorale]|uniref:U-box domain-containing protein n=1 Tax=Gonium pectorale TaxID=33097 RepID=A0A150FWP7_GONPE|nr:hypothetical protein GPECTOR_227g505 [Gonium pectorale]|eukprot:KXZ41998.1 hypothetical protein GPECTOR_227g505 [Gonium pectorale]
MTPLLLLLFIGLSSAELPLYVPGDISVPCDEMRAFHRHLTTDGTGDGSVWEEADDACKITYQGAAVSTPEGHTTVAYDTTYRVHKELLSHVLNAVRRARERDSRQVGDPFVAPYLAGVYQRMGLEYSGLLCFPRITLLWRRLAAAGGAGGGEPVEPAFAAGKAGPGDMGRADGGGSRIGGAAADSGGCAGAGREACPAAAMQAEAEAGEAEVHTVEAEGSWEAGLGPESGSSPRLPPGRVARRPARLVPLASIMQQLHRELVLEPWKPVELRLMLGRAAAYAEALAATDVAAAAAAGSGGGGIAASCATGWMGAGLPWLPRGGGPGAGSLLGSSGLLGGGLGLGPGPSAGGCGPAAGGGGSGEAMAGPGSLLWWALWAACPTVLVALDTLQSAPDHAWMALYIAVIATCRTLAEWRTGLAVLGPPRGRPASARLGALAAAHGASAAASVLLTGLLNSWLPLLGHGAAMAVVWLHLLLLPAVMVAVMGVAGMPLVALMREPAQASSGVTYERPAIMQWLEQRRVDPVTHVPLKRHRLAPNLNLRHMIEVWVQDRVEARRRLAQRLRDEVAAEAAAFAAATGATACRGGQPHADAAAAAAASGTHKQAAVPATQRVAVDGESAAVSVIPPGDASGRGALGAAAAPSNVWLAARDGPAREAVGSDSPSPSPAAGATGETPAADRPRPGGGTTASSAVAGGGDGRMVRMGVGVSAAAATPVPEVRVEAVEALAAAASRVRAARRRRALATVPAVEADADGGRVPMPPHLLDALTGAGGSGGCRGGGTGAFAAHEYGTRGLCDEGEGNVDRQPAASASAAATGGAPMPSSSVQGGGGSGEGSSHGTAAGGGGSGPHGHNRRDNAGGSDGRLPPASTLGTEAGRSTSLLMRTSSRRDARGAIEGATRVETGAGASPPARAPA